MGKLESDFIKVSGKKKMHFKIKFFLYISNKQIKY